MFLIVWILFLVLWSSPMLLIEYGTGRYTRKAVIGSFRSLLGEGAAWCGAWISMVTFLISLVVNTTVCNITFKLNVSLLEILNSCVGHNVSFSFEQFPFEHSLLFLDVTTQSCSVGVSTTLST